MSVVSGTSYGEGEGEDGPADVEECLPPEEESMGVETELWLIFTHYALHSSPLSPMGLAVTQLQRFAKDCRMLDGRRLTAADTHLIFTTMMKKRLSGPSATRRRRGRHQLLGSLSSETVGGAMSMRLKLSKEEESNSKLTYSEFLNSLVLMARKLFGSSITSPSVDSMLQRLLMEHVLPLAQRRRVSPSATSRLSHVAVEEILQLYRPALQKIFQFYANGSPALPGEVTLSYQGFVGFASSVGLSGGTISTLDVGDMYLSCVAPYEPTPELPLTFDVFLEMLVRASEAIFPELPPGEGERALLAQLFSALHTMAEFSVGDGVGRATSQSGSRRGILLRGVQLYDETFVAQWREGGGRSPDFADEERLEDGQTVLKRLLTAEVSSR
jgi:hypothetical protein